MAQSEIIPANVPTLYIVAIVLAAIFFGLGPSIFSCLLSVAAYNYFFIPPFNSFSLSIIQDVPNLLIFLVVGILINYLSSVLRNKTKEANREIAFRKESEAALINYRDHLEDMVKQRTIELEKTNVALRESETFSYSLLDNSPNPILHIDLDISIKYVNQAFEQLTGFSAKEVMGSKRPFPWWALLFNRENQNF